MPEPIAHRVVHFEMKGADRQALERFYAALFDWEMRPVADREYTLVDTRSGSGINGGIAAPTDAAAPFYVAAADLAAVLERAQGLGGSVARSVTRGIVTTALLADPDGLLVGLVESDDDVEASAFGPSPGDGAPVDWFEVMGSEPARTQRFYTELFGWRISNPGFQRYALVDGGGGIGGGLGGGSGDLWTTAYARVRDVRAILETAAGAGGTRIYGPLTVGGGMRTGAFRDPAGNVLGVYSREEG